MALFFTNGTEQTIWITFAWYDPGCGDANQNFRKQGWWQLDAGQSFNAWNVDVRTINRYAYFYAETANDGTNWSGNGNAWLSVNPDASFYQCAIDNAGDPQWVDFFEIDFSLAPAVAEGWDFDVVIWNWSGGLGIEAGNFVQFQTRSPDGSTTYIFFESTA